MLVLAFDFDLIVVWYFGLGLGSPGFVGFWWACIMQVSRGWWIFDFGLGLVLGGLRCLWTLSFLLCCWGCGVACWGLGFSGSRAFVCTVFLGLGRSWGRQF